MSLSPWDLSAEISFDFSLYRSRRDSYVYATHELARGRRNPSYRRATKHPGGGTAGNTNTTSGLQDTGSSVAGDEEDAERLKLPPLRKKRALSYRAAVRHAAGDEELSTADVEGSHPAPADDKCPEADPAGADNVELEGPGSLTPPLSPSGLATPLIGRYRSTKNLLVLSVGFVFIFSAFRALQNLQTSVHEGRVGALVLTLVHGLALVTGFLGPLIVSRLGPRWSIVLAALIYPAWATSNLCVTGGAVFYLMLLTSSALVGLAQSLAWTAQVRATIGYIFYLSLSFIMYCRYSLATACLLFVFVLLPTRDRRDIETDRRTGHPIIGLLLSALVNKQETVSTKLPWLQTDIMRCKLLPNRYR